MSRRQRRMLRRARGQAVLRAMMLLATAAILIIGLGSHLGESGFQAENIPQPTATPVTSAFDETVEAREVALDTMNWYAIQTGVYSTRDAADSRADAYADRGAPGYVTEDGGKWRVLIACYADKADADVVRERLSTMQQVETHLHTWSAPAVTLRLSGMAGQLDVAQTGLNLPGQAAEMLRDAAIALDAGESTMDSAMQTVEALQESITLWAKTAKDRFATPHPALIASVLDFASAWTDMYAALSRVQDATQLSAQLKKQAMAAFDHGIRIRRSLLAQ